MEPFVHHREQSALARLPLRKFERFSDDRDGRGPLLGGRRSRETLERGVRIDCYGTNPKPIGTPGDV
jgi:hypothetical protein